MLDYLRRYPEVNIECWFVDRMVNLVDEGADVAIRIGELADSSDHAVRVGSVRRIVCASPGYLKKRGTPKQPADLAQHTIIVSSASMAVQEWRLQFNGATRNVRLNPRLLTTSHDAAIAAAVDGFGLTRVLSYQVAEQLRSGKLKIVLQSCELEPLPVHVLHREGRRAAHKVRAFVDLAVAQLRVGNWGQA